MLLGHYSLRARFELNCTRAFALRFLQLSRTSSTPLRITITSQKQNLKGFSHHTARLPRALRSSLATMALLAFCPWASLRIFPSSIHSNTIVGISGHQSPLPNVEALTMQSAQLAQGLD
jgi:hypothetical protein